VVCDQIIDYTHGRVSSYSDQYGESVRHIDLSEPYTPALRQLWLNAARACDEAVHDGGVMAVTQGPRLETRAEIARLLRDGCDVVGMTAMPEAALARELDMAYASLAVSANWAAGRGPAAEITMAEIEHTLKIGMARALRVMRVALAHA
jgi:5'-methylthioinosine phosphorylase